MAKGLSSDCKLPPEIAIALQLDGEYPCDRCNVDRETCRGAERKEVTPINYINIRISSPYLHQTKMLQQYEFVTEISIDAKTYRINEVYPLDVLNSLFDRIWESTGIKLKQAIKKGGV